MRGRRGCGCRDPGGERKEGEGAAVPVCGTIQVRFGAC